jgi:hypothetical protein
LASNFCGMTFSISPISVYLTAEQNNRRETFDRVADGVSATVIPRARAKGISL